MHLRTPGQEHKEDIATGHGRRRRRRLRAILAMPNTDPVVDSPPVMRVAVRARRAEARRPAGFLGAISRRPARRAAAELGALADAGAVGFTDDGRPVESAGLLRRAFQYASITGRPLVAALRGARR